MQHASKHKNYFSASLKTIHLLGKNGEQSMRYSPTVLAVLSFFPKRSVFLEKTGKPKKNCRSVPNGLIEMNPKFSRTGIAKNVKKSEESFSSIWHRKVH